MRTVILSLFIGIGANTAIFTAANALLLAPTPAVRDIDQLVNLRSTENSSGFDTVSYALYADLRNRVPPFENVFAERLEPVQCAIGIIAALGLTRFLSDLLLGISPNDPRVRRHNRGADGVALAASYLPARGAARLNPVAALRAE
jgi:hypothetical protein